MNLPERKSKPGQVNKIKNKIRVHSMTKRRKKMLSKNAYLKSKCLLSLQIQKNIGLMKFSNTTIKKDQMIKMLQILCCTNLLYFFNYLSSFKGLRNEDITFSGYILRILMLKFYGLH